MIPKSGSVCRLGWCLLLAVVIASSPTAGHAAPHQCTSVDGGGSCPRENTCCRLAGNRHARSDLLRPPPPSPLLSLSSSSSSLSSSSSGCIPNDMPGPLGTCCGDGTNTGCAPNYECKSAAASSSPSAVIVGGGGVGGAASGNHQRLYCRRGTAAKDDPLVRTMPRYALCSPPSGTLARVHGLNITDRSNQKIGASEKAFSKYYAVGKDDAPVAALAYYSTHGDILAFENVTSIKIAIVMIHGMLRNADDYFCSGTAAASLQDHYDPSSVLILAPRFLSDSDGPVTLTNNAVPIRWGGNDDQFGSWRYGADNSIPAWSFGISSFRAIDELVEALGDIDRFPNLERITVAGHSSGGQFVQRWALLSQCSVWERGRRGNNNNAAVVIASRRSEKGVGNPSGGGDAQPPPPLSLRAVVANPSSYAYLDGRRFEDDGTFRIPPPETTSACPSYNQWEWGLESGGPMAAPYKDRVIRDVGGVTKLAERFASRDVVYLNGGQDRCNVTGSDHTGWCFSHGLETMCGDMLEGKQRLERGERYHLSLREYYGKQVHVRAIVEGVGHDHSLIWESDVGLLALFGEVEWLGDSRQDPQKAL